MRLNDFKLSGGHHDPSPSSLPNNILVVYNCEGRIPFSPPHLKGNCVAKKKSASKSDRNDPKSNKSLAARLILAKMPGAKAGEVAAAVKAEYGHDVNTNLIYMVKTKKNMASDGRPKKAKGEKSSPMDSAERWVSAIATGRKLLNETGSVANAVALLKAIEV
jgi:hypothetical protein